MAAPGGKTGVSISHLQIATALCRNFQKHRCRSAKNCRENAAIGDDAKAAC